MGDDAEYYMEQQEAESRYEQASRQAELDRNKEISLLLDRWSGSRYMVGMGANEQSTWYFFKVVPFHQDRE